MGHIVAQELEIADTLEDLSGEVFDTPYDAYEIGDRIAQLVIIPVPLVKYTEVDELSETERGTDGHGSTGN